MRLIIHSSVLMYCNIVIAWKLSVSSNLQSVEQIMPGNTETIELRERARVS